MFYRSDHFPFVQKGIPAMFAKGWNDNRKQGKGGPKSISHIIGRKLTTNRPTRPIPTRMITVVCYKKYNYSSTSVIKTGTRYRIPEMEAEVRIRKRLKKDKLSEIDDANISKYKYFRDRYSGRNAVKQSINNMVNENITSLLEQEAEAVRNIPVTPRI